MLRHLGVDVGIPLWFQVREKLRAPLVRLPWVVVPIFRVVLPIWVVYPTSRNFRQVAQGRSAQLLGCNTLFHGAPGTKVW
jgi:hypothetical protein